MHMSVCVCVEKWLALKTEYHRKSETETKTETENGKQWQEQQQQQHWQRRSAERRGRNTVREWWKIEQKGVIRVCSWLFFLIHLKCLASKQHEHTHTCTSNIFWNERGRCQSIVAPHNSWFMMNDAKNYDIIHSILCHFSYAHTKHPHKTLISHGAMSAFYSASLQPSSPAHRFYMTKDETSTREKIKDAHKC